MTPSSSSPLTQPASTVDGAGDAPGRELPANPVLAATLDAMADQWSAGQRRPAEDWLAEHRELQAEPELAVRVVYEELCLREDFGEDVTSEEFYRRFPQWQSELAALFMCHQFLQPAPRLVVFPDAGESLGELRLLEELGSGARGRVFLATQRSLSDRPLVVKLTPRRGHEHLSLARLQHTNIVPLYLVQDFPEVGLRALCMPYLGGETWHEIAQELRNCPMGQRTGGQIVAELATVRRAADISTGEPAPALGYLASSTHVEAVCWIGACLADALHYAHQRGLAHLDIKPSNILMAADGQPMLLDFHLASEIERLHRKEITTIGGTPGYTSPEQAAAMQAVRRGLPISEQVDCRSDIYSLGVVLYEALRGQLPAAGAARSRAELRQANPGVSRGIADILHKCLAPAPSARYPNAGELAIDLRCHLANLPLRNVPNHSLAERWRKWRRRRPFALPSAAAALTAVTIVAVVGGLLYRDRVANAEASLLQSQRELTAKQFAPAIQHAAIARRGLRWFPWQANLSKQLEAQLTAARRAQAVDGLHQLVERLRFLDDEQMSDQALAEVLAGCQEIWRARDSFLATSAAPGSAAEGTFGEQLRRDLLDLAILSARIEARLAPAEKAAQARSTALQILSEARISCGESPVLEVEAGDYKVDAASANRRSKPVRPNDASNAAASLPSAASAWEHCGFGRWLMHHEAYTDAARQFTAAIDLQPSDFWPYFQLARCNFELGKFGAALQSATVCVALAPDRAECFYNRAICQQALGRDAETFADLERAIGRDPQFAPALLERGILLGRLKRFAEAQQDLNSALDHGAKPSEVHYQMARLSAAQNDRAGAMRWIVKSLAEGPPYPPAIEFERELQHAARR
ncbi:MAG TPA: protein kinase [Pirellulales bacterium]|jgi:serine/threonine protein kinase|nr:protein kinase [Pirellulales bacterium]